MREGIEALVDGRILGYWDIRFLFRISNRRTRNKDLELAFLIQTFPYSCWLFPVFTSLFGCLPFLLHSIYLIGLFCSSFAELPLTNQPSNYLPIH